MQYLAVVSVDDMSTTPILTSPDGARVVYLFYDESLANAFGNNQAHIENWRVSEIPLNSLRKWIEDQRDRCSATHVVRQIVAGETSTDTIAMFLLHLATQGG